MPPGSVGIICLAAPQYRYNNVAMGQVFAFDGGGTVSLFSAALLPRISFAMPSCYFNTFRDSVMSISARDHTRAGTHCKTAARSDSPGRSWRRAIAGVKERNG